MTYVPPFGASVPPMVSSFTKGIGLITSALPLTTFDPISATFESANRAIYTPITIPAQCVVRRVWWANGASTSAGGTVEVGIYANAGYGPGAKIIAGSAVQGTANQVQFVDVTDTTLSPGVWWIAIRATATTNCTIFQSAIDTRAEAARRFQEASASPLPATATPVESTDGKIYLCGFATTASP